MPASSLRIVVRDINDRQLQRKIAEWAAITGRTVKEETRTAFKSIVAMALRFNPPAKQGRTGKDAQRVGELAISRDLQRMGFAPKTLKGFRMVTKAFGHPIKPVRVETKENPKFTEPDAFHLLRLQTKHGGKVSRGGRQAFYVDRRKFRAMLKRLMDEVGRLSSGWIKAANQLGVPVPAWIARHGGSRGSEVLLIESKDKLSMCVVNYFPDGAQNEATEMIRRIGIFKKYEIGNLARQIKHNLGKNLRRRS